LVVAALVYLSVLNLTYFRTPPGGDAVVGYAWSIIFGIIGFSVCLVAVVGIIGWQGGYGWVGASTGQRVVLVLLGLVLILIGNGFFMANEFPGDFPAWARRLARMMPAVLPPLLLIGAAILLNVKYANLHPVAYKAPVYISLVISALGVVFIMFNSAQNTAAVMKSEVEFQDKIHQNHLNQIDTTDVMKDMVFILVFTDSNHDADVRERALAKIKSRPDWQEELVRRLQNDWAPQAFTFLASNEVDDKSLFPEPVREGVLIQARLIRESIRRCRGAFDMYPDLFSWEVDRALRTVDRFQGMGVDYRPAVQELRNALDEKADFEKPKLHAQRLLDKWLSKH